MINTDGKEKEDIVGRRWIFFLFGSVRIRIPGGGTRGLGSPDVLRNKNGMKRSCGRRRGG